MQKSEMPMGKCSITFETDFIRIPFKTTIDFLNRCVYEFNQKLDHTNVFHDWSNFYYQTPQCDERFI